MTILINAGHSEIDCGAVGRTGLKEADVNMNIAICVQRYLKDKGINSFIIRQDKSLFDVIRYCNTYPKDYDFAVSIHCNAAETGHAHGTETLYYPTSKRGKQIAQCIQEELVKAVGLRDRGIKPRNDLAFLKKTKRTSVLVECAFISNAKEEKMLKENYNLFAQGITRGIMKCIKK